MPILRSYILRLHLVPFLLGFGVITFILEMDALFEYLDLVVNRGVAPGIVLQLFLYSLGYIIALSAPCAVLVAVLMTFGRLSQDNEITALRSSGVSLCGVLVGPLGASVALAVLLTLFNNHVLPESNHAFANLLVDIGRMRPTVKLQEGVFISDFPGYQMIVQSVNGRTNEMRGVTIYKLTPGAQPTTIFAKSGILSYTPDGRTAVLSLKNGEIHEIPAPEAGEDNGFARYRRMVFQTHTIYIQGAGGMLERTVRNSRSDREMSARDLLSERAISQRTFDSTSVRRAERFRGLGVPERDVRRLIHGETGLGPLIAAAWSRLVGRDRALAPGEEPPVVRIESDLWRMERDALRRRIAGLSVEIHKKFSLPVACVVFVLIGAPLGMRVRRAGPAVAFVSIAFFLFYYLCLVGGEELANRLLLPPGMAMWLPNVALGGWGVIETLRACEVLRRPRPRVPAAR